MADDKVGMRELAAVVERIGKLTDALRAAGLEVVVTTDIAINFTVRVDDPKDDRKEKKGGSGAKA